MANLAWTADVRDRVAYLLYGKAYDNIPNEAQALMDGDASVVSPPGKGMALDAFRTVQQLGQWFEMAGASTTTDVGEGWLVAETAYRMSLQARPERIKDLRILARECMQRYVQDFSRVSATANPDGTLAAPTVQSIRYHVLTYCYNQNPPIKVSPDEIDTASLWVLNWLWQKSSWSFRRRQCTARVLAIDISGGGWTESTKTITGVDTTGYTNVTGAMFYHPGATNTAAGLYTVSSITSTTVVLTSSLSVTGGNLSNADIDGTLCAVSIFGLESGESLDMENTRKLYVGGTARDTVSWATADAFSNLRAGADSENLGKPSVFRVERRNGVIAWMFYPWPDDTYTFRFEGLTATPSAPTSTSDTTPFSRFPTEFQQLYKDLVLGKVLQDRGKPEVWKRAVDEVERFAPIYDQQAEAMADQSVRDVYGDQWAQIRTGEPDGLIGEIP